MHLAQAIAVLAAAIAILAAVLARRKVRASRAAVLEAVEELRKGLDKGDSGVAVLFASNQGLLSKELQQGCWKIESLGLCHYNGNIELKLTKKHAKGLNEEI